MVKVAGYNQKSRSKHCSKLFESLVEISHADDEKNKSAYFILINKYVKLGEHLEFLLRVCGYLQECFQKVTN